MSEIYTANDLIRFIYKETTPLESANIQFLIQHNLAAKEEYESLLELTTSFADASLDPDPTSVNIIMEYSHNQAAELI